MNVVPTHHRNANFQGIWNSPVTFTALVGIRTPRVSHVLGSAGSGSEDRGKKRERRRSPQLLLSLLGSVRGVRDELKRSRIEDERDHQ